LLASVATHNAFFVELLATLLRALLQLLTVSLAILAPRFIARSLLQALSISVALLWRHQFGAVDIFTLLGCLYRQGEQ